MATLKDIAAEAGVSLGTASGVLNGAPNFADGTRRRVLAAASELGYSPNLAAKRIRRARHFRDRPRTDIIAHVTRVGEPGRIDPVVAARSLLLARRAAARNQYILPLFYDPRTAFACPPVQNGYVDGVLAGLADPEIARAVTHLAPLVLMDVPFPAEALPDVPLVNFDLAFGMHALARHLASLGHRQIGALTIATAEPFHYHGVRCERLARACAASGLTPHPRLSRPRPLTPATHERIMTEFTAEAVELIRAGEVTALMLVADPYASELVRRLHAAGLQVPRDVSVSGFAATSLAPVPTPVPLTTASYPWSALLDAALDLLLAEIAGEDHRRGEILIRPELEIAASTAPPGTPPAPRNPSGKQEAMS